MPQLIKALSIKQPWAWLVAQGYKNIENRTWSTTYRGPVLIHAGKRPDPQIARITATIWQRFGILIPEALDFGGIVGVATVIDCTQHSDSPWFRGPYGFIMGGAMSLRFTPSTGALGFFDPGQEVLADLQSELELLAKHGYVGAPGGSLVTFNQEGPRQEAETAVTEGSEAHLNAFTRKRGGLL